MVVVVLAPACGEMVGGVGGGVPKATQKSRVKGFSWVLLVCSLFGEVAGVVKTTQDMSHESCR